MDGDALTARFNQPSGIAVDYSGNIFIADTNNHAIRLITTKDESVMVKTIAGKGANNNCTRNFNGSGDCDGDESTATAFSYPTQLSWDDDTNHLWVTDSGNHKLRKITNINQNKEADQANSVNEVTSAIGQGSSQPGCIDGFGSNNSESQQIATLNRPTGIVSAGDGRVFITDMNSGVIRKVISGDKDRLITIAGKCDSDTADKDGVAVGF